MLKNLKIHFSVTTKYQKQYPLIADRIITIALESVDYNEELTEQILNSVVVEQDQPRPKVYDTQEVKRATVVEPKGWVQARVFIFE